MSTVHNLDLFVKQKASTAKSETATLNPGAVKETASQVENKMTCFAVHANDAVSIIYYRRLDVNSQSMLHPDFSLTN
jgi:hypothetical protein